MSTALERIDTPNGNGEIVQARTSGIVQAMSELKAIRTFVANEMTAEHDFGKIPGTGDKPTLLLPGAQKIAMYFNTSPDYTISGSELGNGHVEYVVTTRLVNRASGVVVGSGLGSCSTMEKKYRWRGAGRKCPDCDQVTIMKSKYGKGGWYCNAKAGGCGSNFDANYKAIADQQDARAENPDIHDVRNTVLKMAKKRSLVDATMGLGCLSELFTQDLDDTYAIDPDDEPAPPPPPPAARNNSGHGRGQYASKVQVDAYNAAMKGFVDQQNAQWADRWTDRETGAPIDGVPELINPWQANNHLLKWAVETGRLDASIVPEDAKARQPPMYLAIVFHRDEDYEAMAEEMNRYVAEQAERKTAKFYREHPELDPDASQVSAPEDASQDPDAAWADGQDTE